MTTITCGPCTRVIFFLCALFVLADCLYCEASTSSAEDAIGNTAVVVTDDSGVWKMMRPGGWPTARSGHTAIYDASREWMVVFGGYDGQQFSNEVWVFSLVTWFRTQLFPSGTLPSGRIDHTAIYDPVRDRMIVFGGVGGGIRNDVWALSLEDSTWTQLAPSGPPQSARAGHSAIYDPMRDRMIVFGGHDASSYLNDVWALALGETPEWTQLVPSGSPPSARSYHNAVYDPVRDRMIVIGGVPWFGDVWALSLGEPAEWAWLQWDYYEYGSTAIYDSARDRIVTYWGDLLNGNIVWALSLGGVPQWTQLSPSGTPPCPHRKHVSMFA